MSTPTSAFKPSTRRSKTTLWLSPRMSVNHPARCHIPNKHLTCHQYPNVNPKTGVLYIYCMIKNMFTMVKTCIAFSPDSTVTFIVQELSKWGFPSGAFQLKCLFRPNFKTIFLHSFHSHGNLKDEG